MAFLTLVNVGLIAYQVRLSRVTSPIGGPPSWEAGRPPVTITSADYRPLFSALVSMQADPSTSLTPSQRERIVPLLRRWEEHVHTLESEVVVIFEGRINNLGAARRRAFLDA